MYLTIEFNFINISKFTPSLLQYTLCIFSHLCAIVFTKKLENLANLIDTTNRLVQLTGNFFTDIIGYGTLNHIISKNNNNFTTKLQRQTYIIFNNPWNAM